MTFGPKSSKLNNACDSTVCFLAAEALFCLDLQKNHKPPVYQDTKTGLNLTVQVGSTLCISYSNEEPFGPIGFSKYD